MTISLSQIHLLYLYMIHNYNSKQTRSRSLHHAMVLNSRQTSLPFVKCQRASMVCFRIGNCKSLYSHLIIPIIGYKFLTLHKKAIKNFALTRDEVISAVPPWFDCDSRTHCMRNVHNTTNPTSHCTTTMACSNPRLRCENEIFLYWTGLAAVTPSLCQVLKILVAPSMSFILFCSCRHIFIHSANAPIKKHFSTINSCVNPEISNESK